MTSNYPPGTPPPAATEVAMECLNAACPSLGQVVSFTATRELGGVFLDGDPDTRCGSCGWYLTRPGDWEGGVALVTPPNGVPLYGGGVFARHPAALVDGDGDVHAAGTVSQMRVEQVRRSMRLAGGEQVRRCPACTRGRWTGGNVEDAHPTIRHTVAGREPVPACRWCDGSGQLTTTRRTAA